jgi:esterase/lipase superfamily enzyme
MQERYIKWWTPYLSRECEMLVFGSGRGLPLIIFPTSFGGYHQTKDFGLVDSVAWFVDNNRVTVYCPDSIDLDSFYNKGIHPADRIHTQIAYENVIVHDVFDFARREASTHRVGVCGASLGAYHAANIAFRYPDAVSHLISLSGAFEIMNIVIGTGEWDNTRHESMRLSGILNSKGIRHWLDDRKWCGHDWNYWREMLPYYLSTF